MEPPIEPPFGRAASAQQTEPRVLGRMRSMCPLMHRLFAKIEVLAVSDAAVLIQGETGTGKMLLAAELHAAAVRQVRPMVTVSCTGLSAIHFEAAVVGFSEPAFDNPDHRTL